MHSCWIIKQLTTCWAPQTHICIHPQSFWLSDTALLGVMLCPIAPHRPAELLCHSDQERGGLAYRQYDEFGNSYETFWIRLVLKSDLQCCCLVKTSIFFFHFLMFSSILHKNYIQGIEKIINLCGVYPWIQIYYTKKCVLIKVCLLLFFLKSSHFENMNAVFTEQHSCTERFVTM